MNAANRGSMRMITADGPIPRSPAILCPRLDGQRHFRHPAGARGLLKRSAAADWTPLPLPGDSDIDKIVRYERLDQAQLVPRALHPRAHARRAAPPGTHQIQRDLRKRPSVSGRNFPERNFDGTKLPLVVMCEALDHNRSCYLSILPSLESAPLPTIAAS